MAQICSDATTEMCEASPRAPRRRREEVGRFNFLAGVDATAIAGEFSRKRKKVEIAGSDRGLSGWDRCPRYGMTSVRGRRKEMEDAVSIRPDFAKRSSGADGKLHFFGVFDGHGCSHRPDARDRIGRNRSYRVGI
ncbi:probable protein phosphatase 2C 49 [Asparagus officinalis]|uniref:probable protein phosphatase 2C 49 n=1 Tax=Asparagus officinalis TaxID=4686 RepID=UPI00098DEB47|nr:probable protein phosphatase 2C 49 [Asparagus officinalis]